MASKYLQKFPIPGKFPEMLHDFAREVLREQPENVYAFGFQFFRAMENGHEFNFDPNGGLGGQEDDNLLGGEQPMNQAANMGPPCADEDILIDCDEQVANAFGDSAGSDTYEAVNFVEKFALPPAPQDYQNPNRQFRQWELVEATGFVYQGEWDAQGNCDGRGVAICQDWVRLGHWRGSQPYGQILEITRDGDLLIGGYNSQGEKHGEFKITKQSGAVMMCNFNDGQQV